MRISFGKKVFFLILLIYTLPFSLFSQKNYIYEYDQIVVTASRVTDSLMNIPRSITVISHHEIENAPANSINDLLEYALNVDIRTRGSLGVQADLSIRGSSFDQTLILIDGIKVFDPQTGHHNLDLPIDIDDVERIEILRSPASELYGSNAASGVVNIITREGDKSYFSIEPQIGSFRFLSGKISINKQIKNSHHRLSLSRKQSKGYRYNTDFQIDNLFYRMSAEIFSSPVNISTGYSNKKFGANGFYSDKFPDQWEHTETAFFQVGIKHQFFSGWKISSNTYLRRHYDTFLLEKENPTFYRNNHRTDLIGTNISGVFYTPFSKVALGTEVEKDLIKSKNLGNHSRTRYGVFLENKSLVLNFLDFLIGLYGHYETSWGWRFWHGINLGYQLNEHIMFFTTNTNAFRIPNYTELYYNSPANKGNPQLKLEKVQSKELGSRINIERFHAEVCLFRKEGKSLIDWIRYTPEDPWEAQNISEMNTNGLETAIYFYPMHFFNSIQISYSVMNSDQNKNSFESKYVLNYLKQKLFIGLENQLPFNILNVWKIRWEKRNTGSSYFIVDLSLGYSFKSVKSSFRITNLLNTKYKGAALIPMPGRWIILETELTI